ncbi:MULTISPECIES: LuxR C-terminal-related transcriptional regulator [unclassified Enterobacter]|uniref:LuxR C-terminal-related transcriptional regulator n=1 Tax=unclassified Enterobacter TaxID=2608935 RepID=UPI0004B575CA|nr:MULTISPECIES: LuxR C-terminal-related transcriptional regulator [unclassified Enterobacter]
MMIICVSDNVWFRIGLSEIIQNCQRDKQELKFLAFEKASVTLSTMVMRSPVTIIIDYYIADHGLLLLLLKMKRQNVFDNILIITTNARIVEVTENILLDSVADILIDNSESFEKLSTFMVKDKAGQIISKSVTNKTWAMIKKNSNLTHRELDLMPFFITGKGNKEISRQVDISEKMVSIHRRNIYSKLQVESLTGLYHYLTTDIKVT